VRLDPRRLRGRKARRSSPFSAPSSPLPERLEAQGIERRDPVRTSDVRRLEGGLGRRAHPVAPMPLGWRGEDALDTAQGFLPLREAAEAMSMERDAVLELVRRGLLEAIADERDGLLVRPALVTLVKVKQP
jgi:hypothetical protein